MSQAVRRVLGSDVASERWSQRVRSQISVLRQKAPWVHEDCTTVLSTDHRSTWWTFAGTRANSAIAAALSQESRRHVEHDNLSVTIGDVLAAERLHSCVEAVRSEDPTTLPVPVSAEAVEQLKFSSCLPVRLAEHVLERRLADDRALQSTFAEPVRYS
jgi:ATP-dependent Lhr-like helicase